MPRLSSLWRNLVRRGRVERELQDELDAMFELLVDEKIRSGMTREDAVRVARLEFGSVPAIKDHVRDVRAGAFFDNLARDARYAVRTTVKRPAIPLMVVLAFAVGSAGITTTFALVNRILLRPLPYHDAARLVAVRHAAPGLGLAEAGLSSGTYFHYRAHATSFETLAVYSEAVLTMSAPDHAAERVHVTHAGPELFDVLRARPAVGRLFSTADASPGFMDRRWAIPVVLSHEFWTHRFGGDPGVVGRTITLGNHQREVVGIMPPEFAFPRPETQIWMLFQPSEATPSLARRLDLSAIARLRPGVDAVAARRDLERILPSIAGTLKDATAERLAEIELTPLVVPLKDDATRDVRRLLWLLFGASTVLLLIACANAATLFLLRSERRSREHIIRMALGARRADLARLLLSEAALCAAAAAALGTLLAHLALKAIVVFSPVRLPRMAEVQIDAWTIVFTCLLAALATLVFGALSLLRQSARAGSAALGAPAGGPNHAGAARTRNVLVAVQVALALCLLVGSALMVQSFWKLTHVEPGFEPAGVLTVELGLPGNRAGRLQQIYDLLLERVRALPGVRSASAASSLPLDGTAHAYPFFIDRASRATPVPIAMKFVMPGYFDAMGTALVEGAGFGADERSESPYPVAVSAAFARRYFFGATAIGSTIRRLQPDGQEVTLFDPASGTAKPVPPWTIVAIVADVREESIRGGPAEIVYVPVRQPAVELSIAPIAMSLIVRSDLPPPGVANAVRQAARDIDPSLSVGRIRPMEAIVAAATGNERFLAALLLLSAAASLLLGAIGVFGVAAESVRRREQEIGIRVALGARPGQIVHMVLGETFVLVWAGLVTGLAIALAGTRVLDAYLFGVRATDPLTVAGVSALVVAVALAASLLPARRAVRLDPVVTLRQG